MLAKGKHRANKPVFMAKCQALESKRMAGYVPATLCLLKKVEVENMNIEKNKKGFQEIHGMTETKLYGIWCNMKNRCYNPTTDSYKDYGARGIEVCKCWRESFEEFMKWAYENGYDESKEARECSLDRVDTNGNYEPQNCKWSTLIEQANNKRNNHILEYHGEKMTLAQWARKLGFSYCVLFQRIYRGWSVERALETPTGADKWH